MSDMNVPADPLSPLTAEEIAMVRAASPDPASFTARLLATLDAACAPDAGLRAAAQEIADREPIVTDPERGDEWCLYCDAWYPKAKHKPDCSWLLLRAALASSPAPATTNPRLIETDLVVSAPAGLDEEVRAALLDPRTGARHGAACLGSVACRCGLAALARAATRPAEDTNWTCPICHERIPAEEAVGHLHGEDAGA